MHLTLEVGVLFLKVCSQIWGPALRGLFPEGLLSCGLEVVLIVEVFKS
jgi:hypothetical protein